MGAAIQSETLVIDQGQVKAFTSNMYTNGGDIANEATVTVVSGDIVFRVDGVQPNGVDGHYASTESQRNVIISGINDIIGFRAYARVPTRLYVTYEINK